MIEGTARSLDQPSFDIPVSVKCRDLDRVGHQGESGQDVGELFFRQAIQVCDETIEFGPQFGSLIRVCCPCLWLLRPSSLAKSSYSGMVQVSRAARLTIGVNDVSRSFKRGSLVAYMKCISRCAVTLRRRSASITNELNRAVIKRWIAPGKIFWLYADWSG
jgi:hypothetical protein